MELEFCYALIVVSWVTGLMLFLLSILFPSIFNKEESKQDRKERFTLGAIFYIGTFLIFTLIKFNIWQLEEESKKYVYTPSPIPYSTTSVKVNYYDNTTDTFNIEVYQSSSNIQLESGNLSYDKLIRQSSTSAIAGKTTISSYVKSFNIISNKEGTIFR